MVDLFWHLKFYVTIFWNVFEADEVKKMKTKNTFYLYCLFIRHKVAVQYITKTKYKMNIEYIKNNVPFATKWGNGKVIPSSFSSSSHPVIPQDHELIPAG